MFLLGDVLAAHRSAICLQLGQTGWLARSWRCPMSLFNYLHLWVNQPLCNGLINLLISWSTQCNYIREFRSPSATSIKSERTPPLLLPWQLGEKIHLSSLPPLILRSSKEDLDQCCYVNDWLPGKQVRREGRTGLFLAKADSR